MDMSQRFNEDQFHQAALAYDRHHQGCIACHQPHCVFFSAWNTIEEYRCFHCGFCVWHDLQESKYFTEYETVSAVDVLSDSEPGLLDQLEDHPILRGP